MECQGDKCEIRPQGGEQSSEEQEKAIPSLTSEEGGASSMIKLFDENLTSQGPDFTPSDSLFSIMTTPTHTIPETHPNNNNNTHNKPQIDFDIIKNPEWAILKNFKPLMDPQSEPLEQPIATPLIGLYFSAQWCPPCRQFSPLLSEFAKKNQQKFSVVFISLDKSEQEMKAFLQNKHFYSLPFQERSLANQLATKMGIKMIPTLVILNQKGQVISDWGKSAVLKNPDNCIQEWEKGESGVSWFQLLSFW